MSVEIKDPIDFAIDELDRLQRRLFQIEADNACLRLQLITARLSREREVIPPPIAVLARGVPYSPLEIAREACALGAEGYLVTAVETKGNWWSGRSAILVAEPAAGFRK